MEMDHQLLLGIAYSLGIGILIGLERSLYQFASTNPKEADSSILGPDDIIGVRTFSLLSLLGYGAALAAETYPLVVPVTLAGVSVLVVVMYYLAKDMGTGITTEVAAIGCCALGILCRSEPKIAGILALLFTMILASKNVSQKVISQIKRVELTDTLKFLAIILIVLPLLPNKALDPYGAFNPAKVGLLVVLISGISFVGYFLTRIFGTKLGLGLTGVLGGLTSSTAVTAAMSSEAKRQPHLQAICTFSTLAANATMFVRVLVMVAVVSPGMVNSLLLPLGGMAAVAAAACVFYWFRSAGADRKKPSDQESLRLKNPFSIGPAIKFAIFFVAILFIAKLASEFFGNSGLFAAATLSGLADVDAITLSIAEQTRQMMLAERIGAIGITIAVVSNSAVKTVIAIYSGGWKFGRQVGMALMGATLIGLALALVSL